MQIIRNFLNKHQISILILSNLMILIAICLVLYGWYYLYAMNSNGNDSRFGLDDNLESENPSEVVSRKLTIEEKKAVLEKIDGNPDNVSIEDKRKLLSTLQSSE